jgi:hypothetical protein
MPQSDPIDEFIALPRDQQLSTLQQLSPEKQDKLLGQVKQRRTAKNPPAPKPESFGDAFSAVTAPQPVTGVGSFVGEAGRSTARTAVGTVTGLADAVKNAWQANGGKGDDAVLLRALNPIPQLKTAVDQFKKNPDRGQAYADILGQVLGLGVVGQTVQGAEDTVGRVKNALPAPRVETLRKGAQSLVGAGERAVKANVADTAEAAQKATEATRAKNKAADEKTLAARGKVDEANAKQVLKEAQDRREAMIKNRSAAQEHEASVAETKASNEKAVREQQKIPATQEKLKTAGRELQAQIETARENARKVGNEKYSAVNKELNLLNADMETVTNGFYDAMGKIRGSEVEPPILKSIGKRVSEGDTLNYEDLQGYYSELGRELSKGTLPGDLYTAYDTMHDAIGDDMQRIADSKGQGAQLHEARAYWKRMKQTFGRPYNPTDAANVTLEKTTGTSAADEQANRVRMLGSFDKTIPQTVEHIGNLRRGLEKLPEQLPKPSDAAKVPPPKPEPTPIPKPGAPASYGEPHATTPIERPEVNTRAIREQLLDRWASGEEKLNPFQVRSLIRGGLGPLVGALFGEHLGGALGSAAGAIIGTAVGPAMLARLVENSAVREWITRPPVGELETLQKLPSADRLKITDTLNKVVQQAKTSGKPIPVSSKLRGVLQSGALAGPGLAPRKQEQHPTDAWAGTHN